MLTRSKFRVEYNYTNSLWAAIWTSYNGNKSDFSISWRLEKSNYRFETDKALEFSSISSWQADYFTAIRTLLIMSPMLSECRGIYHPCDEPNYISPPFWYLLHLRSNSGALKQKRCRRSCSCSAPRRKTPTNPWDTLNLVESIWCVYLGVIAFCHSVIRSSVVTRWRVWSALSLFRRLSLFLSFAAFQRHARRESPVAQ